MVATSTRQRLESAALTLFDRCGFDAVTTAKIAETAGVTQRTFFRHFPTKLDALMGDVARRTYDFVLELYRQPPGLGLIDALLAAISATSPDEPLSRLDLVRARVLRDTPSLAGALRAYESDLEAHFAEWIAQRTRHQCDDFDVLVLAAQIVATRRVAVGRWRETSGRTSMVELARRALPTLAAAAERISSDHQGAEDRPT